MVSLQTPKLQSYLELCQYVKETLGPGVAITGLF